MVCSVQGLRFWAMYSNLGWSWLHDWWWYASEFVSAYHIPIIGGNSSMFHWWIHWTGWNAYKFVADDGLRCFLKWGCPLDRNWTTKSGNIVGPYMHNIHTLLHIVYCVHIYIYIYICIHIYTHYTHNIRSWDVLKDGVEADTWTFNLSIHERRWSSSTPQGPREVARRPLSTSWPERWVQHPATVDVDVHGCSWMKCG